jgi:hypothetical protein
MASAVVTLADGRVPTYVLVSMAPA